MKIRLDPPRDGESKYALDLAALLHPANAFSHPDEVVRDRDLTLTEKRAILASWASDACAVESAPELRISVPGKPPVTFDDVMDALKALDREGQSAPPREPHYRRVLAKVRPAYWRSLRRQRGSPEGSGAPRLG
jgi:hypothetical protein